MPPPNLEAVSVMRELPVKLRKSTDDRISTETLQAAAMRVATLFDSAADLQSIKLDHRKFQPIDTVLPTDLLVMVVDTMENPHCLPEVGKLMVQNRTHVVQVVSLSPLPHESPWMKELVDGTIDMFEGLATDTGIIIPARIDKQPELQNRVQFRHMQHFTETDAARAVHQAATLRDRYGRTM